MYSIEGLIIATGFIVVMRVAIVGTLKELQYNKMIREYKRIFPEVWGK